MIPCLALALTGVLTVFTRKSGLLRRRNRAVTLIEAVLYISISLALIVGGLVFFQQASTAAKTSTMVRQLSATLAEGRVLIKGIGFSTVPANINSYLISAGAVPPDMVASATSLSNPFGGTTTFMGGVGAGPFAGMTLMWVMSTDIPRGVCTRLLTATGGSEWRGRGHGATTIVSSGYMMGGVWQTGGSGGFKTFLMSPTEAGWMCKYGSNAYETQNTEPSSATPISGGLTVMMGFLVEA